MKFIKLDALMSWSAWKESRTLTSTEYIAWTPTPGANAAPAASPVREVKGVGQKPVQYLVLDMARDADEYIPPRIGINTEGFPEKIVFVSHRWITSEHPDPDGVQLRELQRRLRGLIEEDKSLEAAFLFYDYSSIPQRPRTAQEDLDFERDIGALRDIAQLADKFIILSESYTDYKERAWCFFEFVVARSVHLFDDQEEIAYDLAFRSNLMMEPSEWRIRPSAPPFGAKVFITSEKMNYKPNFGEVEVIATAFQHLSSCKATHSDDLPLIRLELARHFNGREMTAFGRLVTALAKFFEISVSVIPARDNPSGPIVCRPYFENLEWVRLPVTSDRELSKFAVPAANSEELLQHGYMPMLRLTMPGVTDFTAFLQRFKGERDWERYVVGASQTGFASGPHADCFPTIDHVIHTLLELPTELVVGPDCIYMCMTEGFGYFGPL
jgi:hypothetical protein